MTVNYNLLLLAELSTRIENTQQDFQKVADEAFSRLEVIDPDLVAILLELFERRQAAAHYLATVQFDDQPNACATLAAGERNRILEAVAKAKHGIFCCSGTRQTWCALPRGCKTPSIQECLVKI